ncbi:MAG TPA: carbohydrate kinase family protein, partial [Candidatus Cybelea sp.]|nr:carbohydrate kinase family protein [Candidatus Cybelea sp.]
VGNLNRDVKAGPMRAGKTLFQDGETSVPNVAETIGGGGANSACTAATLGARVAFFGKVGEDGLGSRLERTLTRHGISSHLSKDPVQPSGNSIALSYENGHRHFISCLPASRALTFADLDLQAMSGYQHLLRADLWFSEAMLHEGNGRLFRAARQAGLDVSIDLNWDPHWGHAPASEIQARKQFVRAVLPSVNLVHGNVRELTEFAEAPDLETALQRLVEWGAEAVVVHLGAEGAGYYHQGALIKEPPAPVHSQVNTTGTGDVLSVCMMLLHRCEQATVAERLRLANLVVAQFMEGKRRFIPPLAD